MKARGYEREQDTKRMGTRQHVHEEKVIRLRRGRGVCWYYDCCHGSAHDERHRNLLRGVELLSGLHNLPRIPVFQECFFALLQDSGDITAAVRV